ncbi:hypothetical protein DL766_000629 [Monosporascus sp. MC13-8B]|uniref:BRCT domain-containing protein n=1 Tax=Monosporascus cannonballus TaxID=155416 RepID=A0ABY0GW95_9PEZI|nr:hypothetical protein DL762_008399 [Monosporascus cannonballus]RYO80164.1 hypothetical protein DL763_009010 [Monosporascus cannonballus]RYP38989.1 hypothetical protein DL766_000629 [Monosporascus sp. MC13-8B]
MEVASPPKRMTRARAAAKETTVVTKTKAAATSAKASTTTSTTRPTSNKRKTRCDEDTEENQRPAQKQFIMNKLPTRTRGRPKKLAEPEPQPEPEPEPEPQHTEDESTTAPRTTRGKMRKTAAEPVKPEAPKTTRTRVRKPTTEDSSTAAPSEPVKKTVRKRTTATAKGPQGTITTTFATNPTPGLKSAVSRPASRSNGVIKKTVTFQEPEKENRVPPAATKAKDTVAETGTGMRAKPVRKPAAGGRTTRASARSTSTATEEKPQKAPLSPKKDGQNIPLSRDADSDDELATLEKTPLKPLMKSPIKPPSAKRFEPQLALPSDETEETTQQPSELPASAIFGSPVRRIPPSPWKDALKSPAKRVDAIPSLIFSATKTDSQSSQSPLKASMLQSPAKRPPMSLKALQPPSDAESAEVARSPLKMSLLQSPAKRPASPEKLLGSPVPPMEGQNRLLFGPKSSPAKEEQPIEEVVQEENYAEAPLEVTEDETSTEAAPEVTENETSAEAPLQETENQAVIDKAEGASVEGTEEEIKVESTDSLVFPGRLSAVLPRHADPALKEKSPVEDVDQEAPVETEQPVGLPAEVSHKSEEMNDDPMDVDEQDGAEGDVPDAAKTTPPQSPPEQEVKPGFGLRSKDLEGQYMSESEDELALSGKIASRHLDDTTLDFDAVPATPTPASSKTPRNGLPSSAVKAATRAIRSVSRGSAKLGFTPLAMQLGEWKASSPLKRSVASPAPTPARESDEEHSLVENGSPLAGASPAKSSFFDDEMKIRAEMEMEMELEAALEADIAAAYEDPAFDDVPITNEDVELAVEAEEMSLMDQPGTEQMVDGNAHDDSISDASQEYGDENAVPIDPALLNSTTGTRNSNAPPVTPVRPSTNRNFHTVSKVPLKPADDSAPRSIKKLSASVSRLPPRRPSGLSGNATSPTKDSSKMDIDEKKEEIENPLVTPVESDVWSSIGTPARTPRRDLNPALLRGAVVFVDVHTSEGADASTVFVELLSQMGARCVKSWPWNPSSDANSDSSSSSKIGITHVVYKDGGKRTLEKVRESNGVVQCVGVGWVLDCERENQWLDEAPYYIDTSLVPRGGRNRRKSMEPKALANLNGTLVTPMKNNAAAAPPARECQTVPNNHVGRRDSTIWVHTPSNRDEDEEQQKNQDWDFENMDNSMLTPVPKTPAPESIRQFAMDVTPEAPETPAPRGGSAYGDYDHDDELAGNGGHDQQMLMRTCPPKQQSVFGHGSLLRQDKDKDQSVLMRLMAARRKSLQFAPKIASPLSKAWN